MSPAPLSETAVAVVLGAAFGIGAILLLSFLPRASAPTLSRRIAPYIRDVADPLGLGPAPSPVMSLRDVLAAVPRRLADAWGGSDALGRRLAQAGWSLDPARFRSRQLAAGVGGLVAGGLLVLAGALAGMTTPAAVLVAPICAAAAVMGCDAHLSWAVRTRTRRIQEELPTVLDFLALCLAAGEGVLDSLRRVGDVGSGELTAQLRGVVLAVGTGQSLAHALGELGSRARVPALSRVLDQVIAALERGAPLAQVLQAQASDAREDAKRALIEQAGRKEILMLVPGKIAKRYFRAAQTS